MLFFTHLTYNVVMIGYILAVICSIFFSLYVIPRKLSKLAPLYFSMLMGLGFFISSVVLYLLKPLLGFNEAWSPELWWSVLAGAIWAIGFVAFVKSIDAIGLARSNQWKNLQGPTAVILSLIILGEYATTNPVFALLAGIAVFVSAICFTISNSKEDRKANLNGIYLATLSGLAFGIVTVINKHVTTTVGVYSQQVVWSLCIFLSIFIYILLQKRLRKGLANLARKDLLLGLGAGVIYLGASFFMLQAYRFIPASIGFTIIQLNGIWTIAIGILVFKELDLRANYKRIGMGFLFALIGIALLALARK
jgi:glucose uptake protein GlcU